MTLSVQMFDDVGNQNFPMMNLKILLKRTLICIGLLLHTILAGAIIPHQGRITISNKPFDGPGMFKFALVDQSGKIRWNHEDSDGIPDSNISLHVNLGFYDCKLGDISIPGMQPITDDLFTFDDPLYLRIWFSDGTGDLEQLGPDQALLVAPYAISTPWTKTDEIASLLSDELDEQSEQRETTSLSLIERIVSLGANTVQIDDFNGSIPLSMLDKDVHERIIGLEGNVSLLDANISSLSDRLDNHIAAPIERQNLTSLLTDELDSFAALTQDHAGIISQAEVEIIALKEGQIAHVSKIKSLEGNTTKIFQDLDETAELLLDLNISLVQELNEIHELDLGQQERLAQLDKNISFLSNREIARTVELNSFKENLSDITTKHEEQSLQIVEMERDLALHNTKDGIQDSYINVINDDIVSLKASDNFTETEIEDINTVITNIMIKNTVQDENLTQNNDKISTLTTDLSNLDRNFTAFETLVNTNLSENNSSITSLTTDLSNLEGNFSAFKLLLEPYLKPIIEQQPIVDGNTGPIDIKAGESIEIKVQVDGRELKYQWYLSKKILGDPQFGDFEKVSDGLSSTLPIPNADASIHEGKYKVVVSNAFGEIESDEILINIL